MERVDKDREKAEYVIDEVGHTMGTLAGRSISSIS